MEVSMTAIKSPIEVAPLRGDVNKAVVRKGSIRRGYHSTLHVRQA